MTLKFRSIDGSFNNLSHTTYNQAGRLWRVGPAPLRLTGSSQWCRARTPAQSATSSRPSRLTARMKMAPPARRPGRRAIWDDVRLGSIRGSTTSICKGRRRWRSRYLRPCAERRPVPPDGSVIPVTRLAIILPLVRRANPPSASTPSQVGWTARKVTVPPKRCGQPADR